MTEKKNEMDWIDSKLKNALAEAMEEEYAWTADMEKLEHGHVFSPDFEKNMQAAARFADHSYISIGRRRVRRAVAVALIAVLILAMTAGAVAIQRILVTWNETQNDEAGTLDVTFDVDDPNGQAGEFRFMKPRTPDGYEVVREEKHSSTEYEIEYQDKEDNLIIYNQSGEIESMEVGFDDEDAEFQEVMVNGFKGYSYSKLGNNALYWTDGISLFRLIGTCNMETVWQMAESIQ